MTKHSQPPAFLARWYSAFRLRETIRCLASLDDHLLRDIGIHRGDIANSVRRDRKSWPHTPY